MIFAVILLLTALAISGIAGYFSIIGLAHIFSANPMPIIVMGCVLELGKLVTASFVYRQWDKINFIMKTYFVSSVVILSIITSLGIFGYLSKSYTSDSAAIYDSETKLSTTQSLIEIEKKRLDNLMQQQAKRDLPNKRIELDIKESQNKISELTKEMGVVQKDKNKQNSEIGPIRYISELVYQKNDMGTIDRAVRLIIISLMFVFDPLAILLVVAANMLLKAEKRKNRPKMSKYSIEIDKSDVFNIKNKDLS
jgi:hypothetical protein